MATTAGPGTITSCGTLVGVSPANCTSIWMSNTVSSPDTLALKNDLSGTGLQIINGWHCVGVGMLSSARPQLCWGYKHDTTACSSCLNDCCLGLLEGGSEAENGERGRDGQGKGSGRFRHLRADGEARRAGGGQAARA